MTKDKLYPKLVNIYTDYFEGLYTEQQLKFMLKKYTLNTPNLVLIICSIMFRRTMGKCY